MIGHAVPPDEPLMSAGIDSRAGMELRQTLNTNLGIQLPVTLLYDYQTVDAIVGYIGSHLAAVGTDLGAASDSDDEDVTGQRDRMRTDGDDAAAGKPSNLLKLLRGPAVVRPLFLAAPGKSAFLCYISLDLS